jgi:hypothetical protein
MRKAQHQQLQQGADVSASLRNLAAQRTDLFGNEMDEEERKTREEEEKQKMRERAKIAWDGHTASSTTTTSNFQSKFNVDAQIAKLHSRIGVTWVTGGRGADGQCTGIKWTADWTWSDACAAAYTACGGSCWDHICRAIWTVRADWYGTFYPPI